MIDDLASVDPGGRARQLLIALAWLVLAFALATRAYRFTERGN